MDAQNLPNDTESLKSIILDYQERISFLEEKLSFLQKAIYGTKSEKRSALDYSQKQCFLPGVFDEEAKTEPVQAETVTVPEHTRKKRGRKPIPKDLPRKDIVHDLPEEEKFCACGSALTFYVGLSRRRSGQADNAL